MRKIHIVMPFSRPFLLEELYNIFGEERLNIIAFQRQWDSWKDTWKHNCAPPIVIPNTNDYDQLYHKMNWFIKNILIEDEDYYWGICDDDSIENNVIATLEKMNDDVIFISMKRGDNIPKGLPAISRHPVNTLYAKPEYVKPCGIGLEQMIIKGRIFKTLQYDVKNNYSDGVMAVFLKNNYPIKYMPNLYVLFNWFQEGRWIKNGK